MADDGLILVILGFLLVAGYVIYKIYSYFYNWRTIETLNARFDITRENAYIDSRGYLRWKDSRKLCHRDIAFHHVKNDTRQPFGKLDIHHKDQNKWNNNPANLTLLTRESHQKAHGKFIYDNGKKYIRLGRVSTIHRTTPKAILMSRKWIPQSQVIYREGYFYLTKWIYEKKFGSHPDRGGP